MVTRATCRRVGSVRRRCVRSNCIRATTDGIPTACEGFHDVPLHGQSRIDVAEFLMSMAALMFCLLKRKAAALVSSSCVIVGRYRYDQLRFRAPESPGAAFCVVVVGGLASGGPPSLRF
eukprot:TRINITY_DN32916_c0_g1_i1.p1 TRINITY_DN32916_c0_g1~~TRINITY_DN32916_c0_g1_i1.p1  ORF type:complete len:119 (+),score=5.30 TRINITY_DN32916_c0_g1_i1:51-407(+)